MEAAGALLSAPGGGSIAAPRHNLLPIPFLFSLFFISPSYTDPF
jgi:hypothetical protein